jgi:hypothetical protein
MASSLAFVIFLILFVINYSLYPIFSFSVNQPGIIPIPTTLDRSLAFSKASPAFDLSASFVPVRGALPSDTYTLGLDVWLTGDFMLSEVPRVILYRSKATHLPKTVDTAGKKYPDTVDVYPDTNLIVWLDPYKNDLYVSAVTADNKLITVASENVPVRNVFRIGIVFCSKFLELYMNGKLSMSMPITSSVRSVNQTTTPIPFYPTIKPILNNVVIRNLTYWPRILTANEIRANEGTPFSSSQNYT